MKAQGLATIATLLVCGSTATLAAQASSTHATSGEYNSALGVECGHCHVDGNVRDASKPMFDFASRMARMVRGLNDGPLKGFAGIRCWSCHSGLAIPARLARAEWEPIAAVHASTFVGGRDRLGLAMSVYAASLGVECSHCHVPDSWKEPAKPAHRTVGVMSTIFDLIPTFFDSAVRSPRTQCYMCHQGRVRVERTSG